MSNYDAIANYIKEVQAAFASGHAREHAYRPALEKLMSSFDDCLPVNDPKRSDHGNPDMVFLKRSHPKIIIGYAECKDITVSLDKTEKTNQMERYGGYANLFLTDYLEFRFYRNGEKYQTLSLGKVVDNELILDPSAASQLADELTAFLTLPPEKIRSGKRLAEIMGSKARRIRDNVVRYLANTESDHNKELEKIYQMMRELLVHDLTPEKFADMYAQTLVYGLFIARYGDQTPDTFSRQEARDLVPKSNPFLRKFFDHIAGADFDTRLSYIVDELCEVFAVSNVKEIVHKHLKVTDLERSDKDPIIHFYEDFLQEYDKSERKRMGAYYTPIPVVRFIIRQVDEILKRDFGIANGLADSQKIAYEVDLEQNMQIRDDKTKRLIKTSKRTIQVPRVQVLDPAVGTATFLNETIKFIYEGFKGQEGRWPSYAKDDLIPRLHGFELMMAPYTIAHLKLGMTLQETGVTDLGERLGVYLTNTLEEGQKSQQDLFNFGLAEAVSNEALEAAKIKHDRPIMVVMGNPPYSGESSNNTTYANGLIQKYRTEPGGTAPLRERTSKWLNDDYVKFISFAEELIEKNGEGIVAMITNHGYLDNPTFRGMRWHLARTFDRIYVLDLHGNTLKKEADPDGGRDENVFDIMQGVAIFIGIKNGGEKRKVADIFRGNIYGLRKNKFEILNRGNISWKKLTIDEKNYHFAEQDNSGLAEFRKLTSIEDLFIQSGTGIVTKRDRLCIQPSPEASFAAANDIVALPRKEFYEKYQMPEDVRDWRYDWARSDVESTGPVFSHVQAVNYRPFDVRYTYYTGRSRGFIGWPVQKLMRNFIAHDNLGLLSSRMTKGRDFNHIFVTNLISEVIFLSPLTGTNAYSFPLWLYRDDGTRTANFKPEVLKQLTANLTGEFEPEDILDYIYAVLHSPKYRETYKEFLKIDFPRVPVPAGEAEFRRLVALGRQLRELHLMTSPVVGQYDTTFPIAGSDEVEKISYVDDQVWINDVQYFGNVPEVAWNFYIGGYQPAQKWLKDRKGRKLSNDDIVHYQKIIKVLLETARVMHEIDD